MIKVDFVGFEAAVNRLSRSRFAYKLYIDFNCHSQNGQIRFEVSTTRGVIDCRFSLPKAQFPHFDEIFLPFFSFSISINHSGQVSAFLEHFPSIEIKIEGIVKETMEKKFA